MSKKWRLTITVTDFIMPGESSTFTYEYDTLKEVVNALKRWHKWSLDSVVITWNKKED